MRILFFHQGRINDWAGAVLKGLKRQFPVAEILIFDLHTLIKERPSILVKNAVAAGTRYGWDLVRGKRDLDDAFFTTDYLFLKVREISAGIHEAFPSDFSFQMHSMHDHSSPDRPHFVYTDFTYLSCRKSPVYRKFRWVPERSDHLIDLEREIYVNATCTFSQTQSVVDTLAVDYGLPRDKALNVRYGPNIDASILGGINSLPERYRVKTVLFIGGNWERKGGPELLKAFQLVKNQIPDAKLVILGCEPDVAGEGVEIFGKVPLAALPVHYAQASVFCMPSKLEPSAGVYVEAMHAALPVVALDAVETREIVIDGTTGFLVEAGNVESLAVRLSQLLASAETSAAMGSRARSLAQKYYTWENAFQTSEGRIRECLAIADGALRKSQSILSLGQA